ncbi:MAG: glycosyltransferase family 4 protein [Desulfamplus sp.]|nr:glycosyltransferase family 4 protein [Desulfamplus sp.]
MKVWYDGVIWSRQIMGGVNRYFARLIDGLPNDVEPVLTVEHIRDIHFPTNPRLKVLRCTRKGDKIISDVQCNIVHPTYFELLSNRDILKSHVPVVLTVHDALHELFPALADPSGEQQAWKKALIPAADHLICVSHNTKKDVMEIFGVPESRISVVHHASDLSVNMANEYQLAYEWPYFLYVGHRYSYKNVPRLLDAFSILKKKRTDIRLCFTGTPFSAEERCHIASLELDNSVIYSGYVSDSKLAALYKNAVALVYPSLYEGFGIPLLEAMACNCPVIASNTSSIPEVTGDASLLVDPMNTDEMAHAMGSLLDDDSLRKNLVERGKYRTDMFSWEKTVADTVKVYRTFV